MLSARDGYALWARSYGPETAVSALEDQTVRALDLPSSRALLDVGCGTARRTPGEPSALVVGVDLSPAMLARAPADQLVAVADACALPLRDGSFDRVWCRLMIGHIAAYSTAYRELARVCAPGGLIVVSDFHPDAAAAGHRRTFRDANRVVHEVEHHVHPISAQQSAARRHGLEVVTVCEAAVGPTIEHFYRDAGVLDAYEEQRGLPLVVVFVLRKPE